MTGSDDTFTIRHIREAMSKLPEPVPSEIRIGSLIRFREEMRKRGAKIEGHDASMVFGGVPVIISRSVPENMAIIFEGGAVKAVIKFDE